MISRRNRSFAAALVVAGACAQFAPTLAQTPPRVQLAGPVRVPGGLVSGVAGRKPDITAFKGVPFAAPPVGEGRWRAPQAVKPWDGVRTTAAFSPSCIQTIVEEKPPWTREFMTHGEVSEDCLYLNVWTPVKSAAEKRPVLVYIYGGANTEGSGMVPVYDGEGLASKGLVVVNFNYRVGVLGFFTHPGLSQEASYHASGNYGLLDQIAAVKWVRDNIAGFGGDPDRITIVGQSAGGQGVHNLTASPLAKGTFHRAIVESSSASSGGRRLADAEADGVKFAQAKGAASLAELRAKSWQEIVAPLPAAPAPPGGGRGAAPLRFSIVIDGYALPAPVTEIFAQGKQNDVPTLTGSNADEGGAQPQPAVTAAEFERQARQRYGEEADAFLRLYPAADDQAAKVAANASARDQARVGLYVWAINRAKTAHTAAYTYFWNHALPGPDSARYGAFHTSEVPYVLNTLAMSDRPFTAVDRKVADLVSSYWVNFATSGDPNGKGLPAWPAADGKNWMTMELGERPRAIPVADSPEKRAFHERVLARR